MLRKLIIILALLLIPTISSATRKVMGIQGSVQAVTQTTQSTDAVQQLPADVIATTGREAIAVYITCEEANIRWTVGGVDPVQELLATPGLGHILYSSYSIRIVNMHWIKTFRYISELLDTPARLQITTEFDR